MRKLFAFGAATGLLAIASLAGQPAAAGVASAALRTALDDLNLTQKAQYIYQGRRHCFYRDGWHGPGWYWCGYNWRRGYGWGGDPGWQGWNYRMGPGPGPGFGPGYGPGPAPGVAYYRPNFARWRTGNGCQPNWTVQDGLCKPYRGY